MPTYDVTSPDGKKYRVTAPGGATQDQIIAYAQTQLAQQSASKPDIFEQTAKDDSTLQNAAAAVGGVISGIPLGVRQMVGKDKPGEVDEWKRAMSGLWSTPGGKVGTVLGGVATMAPAAFIPGANTAAGAAALGAINGLVQPVGRDESRVLNTVVGGAVGGLSQAGVNALGNALTKRAANKAAALATEKVQNAGRDALVQEARAAGFVIPPNQIHPGKTGALNRLAEGLSGKIQTAQQAAIQNEPVAANIVKRELSLPEDLPLSVDAVKTVRSAAGEIYKIMKSVGTFNADDDFARAMGSVMGEYRAVVAEFPGQANAQIESLASDLAKQQFKSAPAVELVKRLRFDGFKNIRSIDPEKVALGRVQIGAQDALEALMERDLERQGVGQLAQVFRNARTLIAKTYTVENAIEPSTGKLVMSKIGKEYSKGKPLTGGLATIGKFAEAFPKAAQNVNSSMPGLSPLDAAGALLGAAATGSPVGAALPLARPLTRAVILSDAWQNAMSKTPKYEISKLDKLMPELLKKPMIGLLGASQVPALFGSP